MKNFLYTTLLLMGSFAFFKLAAAKQSSLSTNGITYFITLFLGSASLTWAALVFVRMIRQR